MRVCLIETWSPDSPGSMRRYGDLIEEAFKGDLEIELVRHQIGVREKELQSIPRFTRTPARHYKTWSTLKSKLPAADVYHVTDGSCAYLANSLRRKKVVVTVHDLIPLLQDKGLFAGVRRPSAFARFIIQRSLSALGTRVSVIADSEATAVDLSRYAKRKGDSIDIVYPPLLPQFITASENRAGASAGGASPFIFHLGNNAFYKNRLGVLEVFARVREKCQVNLVLAGPSLDSSMQKRISELGISESVEVRENPSDEQIQKLYCSARLLLFPSHYEGFGWPPLEAMACGCPVVAGSGGSLAEVVGDGGIVLDSHDLTGLANACCRVLQEPELASKLAQRGRARCLDFSVSRFRQGLAKVYRSAGH